MTSITVADLAKVVYTSGKVFDGLATGRLDTENFLRSGSLEGVTSRADLALLEDLRDAGQFIIDHSNALVDVEYVSAINSKISRSGALHPGQLRTDAQRIGVNTPLGRHEPPALTTADLAEIIQRANDESDPFLSAPQLFVDLARAQPFEDGNKRTAIFAANGLLLSREAGVLLSVPFDEADPTLSRRFTDLLARAYLFNEDTDVMALMREHGISPI